MNRRSHRPRPITDINITPFTDVILVLLIIFMVATPLILQASINIKLPEASTAVPLKNLSQRYITITAEGVVYLDKEIVTRKELKRKMESFQKENPDLSVVLRVDKAVRFNEVVSILDTLTELQIHNLSIAALTTQ